MRSLALKIALACIAASLSGIALMAVLAGRVTSREFGSFVFEEHGTPFITYLQNYYQANGSWAGVQLNRPPPQDPPPDKSDSRFGRGGLTLADVNGVVVFAGEGFFLNQQLSAAQLEDGEAIDVNGARVGTLILVPDAPGYGGPEGAAFLGRLNTAFWLSALGAAIIALLLGGLLANALTRPLKQLTQATHAIARGQLHQQVTVHSKDEIGELAQAFNRMSADLARVSQLRRQMTADIAHDLRTPLSLIQAHAEALRDGVLPPSPETFTLIHDEALRLSRLVEDLRLLSLADAGELALNRRPCPPAELLERAVSLQTIRAQTQGVTLTLDTAPDLPLVNVDPDRLAQVLGNLLDNALRYTPAGGRVTCRATVASSSAAVLFAIADTGPGLAPADLPHVFERFYRADPSRHRDSNGSGLGLAIARSLVEAHGGRIWAETAPGAGAQFFVELPLAAS